MIAQRVAALFAVVIVAGGILFTQVDAIRVPVMQLIITAGEKFSVINVDDPAPKSAWSKKFDGYMPTYAPEGFMIESVEEYADVCRVTYSDGEGTSYSVSFYKTAWGGAYDTEDSTITERALYGYPAVIIEKSTRLRTILIWYPDGHEYDVIGAIPTEEALRILESIPNEF